MTDIGILIIIIIFGVFLGLFLSIMATYEVDYKDLNKGICPKCGKPMIYEGKIAHLYHYRCKDWCHFAFTNSHYLHHKYGKKLERANKGDE